ncbi:MAG: GPW/gp25 family protein [Spirulina sp. SIO3F2]|nr:GPW/gp25 family protein [Spirulina sp. SIO3F2]
MSNNSPQIQDAAFLGTGWTFPPRFDRDLGEVELVADEAKVRQSLEIILATQPGERLMQPNFGCELSQFLFETIQQGVITSVKSIVSDALLYHEPRIKVNDIEVDASESEVGLLLIKVDYTIRQTNTRFNLVYPFYLTEANGG